MSFTITQIIELRTPQYKDDPRLNDLITLAKGQTGSEFGDCYNNAVALRVMHWLTKETLNNGSSGNSGTGQAGRILSEKEGKLAVTYSKSSNTGYEDLQSTQYGCELIELMNGCLFLPRNRFVPDGTPYVSPY